LAILVPVNNFLRITCRFGGIASAKPLEFDGFGIKVLCLFLTSTDHRK